MGPGIPVRPIGPGEPIRFCIAWEIMDCSWLSGPLSVPMLVGMMRTLPGGPWIPSIPSNPSRPVSPLGPGSPGGPTGPGSPLVPGSPGVETKVGSINSVGSGS